MKKLTAALALALTVSLLTSSAVSAAMLKPKNVKVPTTASELAPNAATDKNTGTPTYGKTLTIVRKSVVPVKNSKLPKAVGGKNGTESITLHNVVAVKRETITLVHGMGAGTKSEPHVKDVTIYEVPVGSLMTTTSANKTGKASTNIHFFTPDADGKTYTYAADKNLSLPVAEMDFGETIVGVLMGISVRDELEIGTEMYYSDNPVFVRVVPAE